jgi:hypothetical protein
MLSSRATANEEGDVTNETAAVLPLVEVKAKPPAHEALS